MLKHRVAGLLGFRGAVERRTADLDRPLRPLPRISTICLRAVPSLPLFHVTLCCLDNRRASSCELIGLAGALESIPRVYG